MSFISFLVITCLILVAAFLFVTSSPKALIFEASNIDEIYAGDIDAYVNRIEQNYPDIVLGAEKKIIWADKKNKKTQISLVYIHGFSATRQEVSPLTENMAKQLNANIFLTRLTGHGRPGDAMGDVTVEKLLTDTLEAFEIGKLIGEKVIVIGLSTGATLATWLAVEQQTSKLAGVILLSPNYGLIDSKANWLLKPSAKYWLPIVEGGIYEFEPANELQKKYWTWRYPTTSLIPMMQLVDFVVNLPVESVRTPVLMMYSENDLLIDTTKIENIFSKLTSEKRKLEMISGVQGPQRHVLAGDILSPNTTQIVQSKILAFIEKNIKK